MKKIILLMVLAVMLAGCATSGDMAYFYRQHPVLNAIVTAPIYVPVP